MKSLFASAASAFAFLLTAHSFAAAPPSFIGLGDLAGGVFGIAGDGSVVVGTSPIIDHYGRPGRLARRRPF
jgi:hypothetical protein